MIEYEGSLDLSNVGCGVVRLRQPLGGFLQSFREFSLKFDNQDEFDEIKCFPQGQKVKIVGFEENGDKIKVDAIKVL
jgi:hypothetical protein